MGYLRGRVQHVIFQGGTYHALSFKVEDTDYAVRDESTTVSGHMVGVPNVTRGMTIHLMGEWVNHSKYGRQFQPRGWLPWAPTTREIQHFLHECLNIGSHDIVEEIVSAFRLDTFEVLNNGLDRIRALAKDGEHEQKLNGAIQRWQSARGLSDLSVFLQDYGLGPETVAGIYAKFGDEATEIISKNPYRLVVVEGFSFGRADHLANQLNISRDDPRRVEGAVLWALRHEALDGHLFMRRGELPNRIVALTATERADPFNIDNLYQASMEAVARLYKENGVQVDTSVGLYLPDFYLYERESANKLATFLTPSEIEDVDLDAFLASYEDTNQIELSDAQKEAVHRLITNKVLVVTGLPGTGKTTVVRTFVQLFKDAGIRFSLMAPTGIAAKRLAAVTNEDAQTVHRAFGYNGLTWVYGATNKMSMGAVIVDEMSMVDQALLYRLLDALHPGTMLVLVGDDAQLPSVGPGNVLREMVSCPDIPHVRLTQIFRQAQTSDIVLASHKVNNGESPLTLERDRDSEFQFVHITEEEKIVDLIVEMAAKLKGRDENFQVIAPRHEGVVGVKNLNKRLRDRLNPEGPHQKEWQAPLLHVREGDRLMVVRNNYGLNVYNGDMGKLLSIGKDKLQVKIHGVGSTPDTVVHISKELAPKMLKLAYAITVHKSQGSEFGTVVMPIVRTQGRMLQRNLFYTAVTRARQKVWLLGDPSAVQRSVENDKVIQRNTVLGQAISDAVAAAAGVEAEHETQEPAVVP